MEAHVPRLRRARRLVIAGLILAVLLLAAGWQGWVEYNLRLARRLAERRDFQGALDHLGRCRFAWPRGDEVLFLTARTARRAGRYAEAQDLLAACKAADYDPDAVTLERTLLHVQQGELPRFESYLKDALDKGHPDSPLILEVLAESYMRAFRLLEAERCLDRWLAQDPDAVQALVWHADVSMRIGRENRGLEDYRRAVALDPTRSDARLKLAELSLIANTPRVALEHYEYLAAEKPDDPVVLLGLARCHCRLEETDLAIPILNRLLAQHPDDAGALAERGRLEMDAGRPGEAETWLRKAVAARPHDKEAVYQLMLCLQQIGKSDEVEAWRTRLREIDTDLRRLRTVVLAIATTPLDPDLRREAGEIMVRQGQEEEGLRWLRSALALDPDHAPTHRVLADYFERHGQKEEAAQHRRLAEAPAG